MKCSSLNSHLFRKNIVADPSCQCRAFESPHHFFGCPRYAAARTRYLPNNIKAYTSHDFLFGIDNKTQEKMKLFLVKCKNSLLIPDGLPEEPKLVTNYHLFKSLVNNLYVHVLGTLLPWVHITRLLCVFVRLSVSLSV